MGYMRHHAIVVTGPERTHIAAEDIDKALAVGIHAVQREVYTMAGDLCVSAVLPSKMNGYGSFLVAPDGSKEGWAESDAGDAIRDKIIAYLETLRYMDGSTSFDYAEIQFGDDEHDTRVIRDSDSIQRQP